MCGISGFAGEGDRRDIVAMTNALSHRGPDGEGFFTDASKSVFLGHRRLAILDIAGGAQPFWNEDDTVCVVFNGEIYNHEELREELVRAGHVFKSDHSDTEVLVHGYEEWGPDLPRRLNGMFAFAIYDTKSGTLFLARDRFGEKPLYYCDLPHVFAFASELHALVRHRRVPAELDPLVVQKYFAHGFVPAPNAIYRSCRKLAGGSHLTLDVVSRKVRVVRYWRFELAPDATVDRRTEDDLAAELRHLVIQATKRRLISDVPLGLFLSGGVDSSSILACTKKAHDGEIKTFTIGFAEPTFDESGHAEALARHFGTAHYARQLDLSLARDLVPEVLRRMDEPLADASLLPTFLLSRFTRENVTVALSGDAGDELFAGYDPFVALGPARVYDAVVPRPVHRALLWAVNQLPPSDRNMSLDFKLRRTLLGLSQRQALWNPVWLGPMAPGDVGDLFASPHSPEEIYSEVLDLWNRDAPLGLTERSLEFYTNFYLQDDILAKVDRAAMMSSLESRAVFLDNDVVDFCIRLPTHHKIRGRRQKVLLKKAMQPLLPPGSLDRKKKGFGIPATKWLRHIPVPSVGPTPEGDGGVNARAFDARWAEHRGGRRDHRLLLWAALALELHRSAAADRAAIRSHSATARDRQDRSAERE